MLVADFEDTATGLNHPVAGTTAIPADGVWRHVAAVYDGTTWRLYLDGVLQTQLVVGAFTPQFNSIQHAALGSALNSTGGIGSQTQGFFDGVMDEARIWNYARSAQQISRGRNLRNCKRARAPRTMGLQHRHRNGARRQFRPFHQRNGHRNELGMGGGRAVLDSREYGTGSGGGYRDDG